MVTPAVARARTHAVSRLVWTRGVPVDSTGMHLKANAYSALRESMPPGDPPYAQTASEATPTNREHLRALGALPEKLRPFLARPWSPRAQTAQRERMPPRDRQCAPNALQEPMPTAQPLLLVLTAPSKR